MLSYWYSTTKQRSTSSSSSTTTKKASVATTATAATTAPHIDSYTNNKTITNRRTSFINKRILHLPPSSSSSSSSSSSLQLPFFSTRIRNSSSGDVIGGGGKSIDYSIGSFYHYFKQQQQQEGLKVVRPPSSFYSSLYSHSFSSSSSPSPSSPIYNLLSQNMRQYHHYTNNNNNNNKTQYEKKRKSPSTTTTTTTTTTSLLKQQSSKATKKSSSPFLLLLSTAIFVSTPLLAYLALFGNTADASDVTTLTKEDVLVEQQQLDEKEEAEKKEKKCPIYGCSLLPQDVYYDKSTRFYLSLLRQGSGGGGGEKAISSSEEEEEEKKSEDVSPQEEKEEALQALQNLGTNTEATLTLIGYKGGKMEHQINQDRAFVISPYILGKNKKKEGKLLGVFDGHAKLGELVSQHAVSTLPSLLYTKLSSSIDREEEDQDEIKKALHESFLELDKTAPANLSGGCTASVIYHPSSTSDNIYIANAGDSRSFVVSYNKPLRKITLEYVSREDKPHLPEERTRVEQMGGRVYVPPEGNGGTSRVMYLDSRGNQFGLAMSRSIGDWDAGRLGVIPDPIVDVVKISDIVAARVNSSNEDGGVCVEGQGKQKDAVVKEDGTVTVEEKSASSCTTKITEEDIEIFAISATDGLLDYVSLDTIATHVAKGLFDDSHHLEEEEKKEGGGGEEKLHLLNACEDLILTAAKGWHDHKGGRYRDDIAIAVSVVPLPSSLKRGEEE